MEHIVGALSVALGYLGYCKALVRRAMKDRWQTDPYVTDQDDTRHRKASLWVHCNVSWVGMGVGDLLSHIPTSTCPPIMVRALFPASQPHNTPSEAEETCSCSMTIASHSATHPAISSVNRSVPVHVALSCKQRSAA